MVYQGIQFKEFLSGNTRVADKKNFVGITFLTKCSYA